MSESETVPVYLVKYPNSTEVETSSDEDGNYRVENHNEIEKQAVIHGMSRESAEKWGMDIIDEDSRHWQPGFTSIKTGDEIEIGDPYV